MKKKGLLLITLATLALTSLAGCGLFPGEAENGGLTASGQVNTNEVGIATEISGRVVSVNVNEGDTVKAGDTLFQVDDTYLRTQEEQAAAAVKTAEAALKTVRAQVESTRVQRDLALQGARAADQQARAQAWLATQPDEFDLPVWYFQKDELIKAAESEVSEAEDDLAEQTANLTNVLNKASNTDFVAVEADLAKAQAAFSVTLATLQQAQAANNDALEEAAQAAHDKAITELDAAQLKYSRVATTAAAEEILEARSKVAVARQRLDTARDQLSMLQQGAESLQVAAAEAGLAQAEAGVEQAEAALSQAQAALNAIRLQIEKTTVKAPVDGIVLTRNLEQGEIAAAGGIVMTIGQLEEAELTVYIAETAYGRVNIGQAVNITVDSFPNRTFRGVVSAISNQAEYTPRNVQTVDGRKTTVYAITLRVDNADQALKPGMPADVVFVE